MISFWVLAVLARSINLGLSEHVVRAEAVYSVLALSAFNAGPLAAKAIGVIPVSYTHLTLPTNREV